MKGKDFMTQISEEINYKEAYEREHLKSAQLASSVAELEEKNDLLEFKLNRIKTNPLWVHTTGLRKIMHAVLRQATRVKNCGGVRGVIAKIDYKKREAEAKKQSISENTEYVFLYTAEDRNNALNNTNTLVATGEAIICLMDKYNYDILRNNNAFATLEEVLGYTPEFARDEYSVYLKDTDFGKYFESAFELLPDDTIICIRQKVAVGGGRDYDEIYKGHTALFKKIFSCFIFRNFE